MGLTFARLWASLWTAPEMRILMVGLDAAGKTSILYKVRSAPPRPPTPAEPARS